MVCPYHCVCVVVCLNAVWCVCVCVWCVRVCGACVCVCVVCVCVACACACVCVCVRATRYGLCMLCSVWRM